MNSTIILQTASELDQTPAHNPVQVYLEGLKSPHSRRVMKSDLNTIAAVLGAEPVYIECGGQRKKQDNVTCFYIPWHKMDSTTVKVVQTRLAEKYSAATVNRMISALRGVLAACWDARLMDVETYQRAVKQKPVKGATLPAGRDLNQGEFIALAQACAVDTSAAGVRDSAIIGILYTCGLRRAELAALDIADYDPASAALTVRHGKGNKDRKVYVSNGAKEALEDWLVLRGDFPGALFNPINKAGKIQHPKPNPPEKAADRAAITAQAVYNMLKKRAAEAGVKDFSPHDFRRTFIGDLLDRGVDIVTVQKMAGHSNPDTTARYDRRPEQAKADAAKKLHYPYRSRRLV